MRHDPPSPKRAIVLLGMCVGVLCGGTVAGAARRRFFVDIRPPGTVWVAGGVPINGVVALAPEVRYVPTGSVLEGMATVSHDRRYVTITTSPQQSALQTLRRIEVDLIWNGFGRLPPPVAPAAGPVAAPPPGLRGEDVKMANAAGLLARQRKAVAKVLQKREMAEARWDLANGARLAQLRFAEADAIAAAQRTRAARQIHALLAERDEIAHEYHQQVMAFLTPIQRTRANAYLLSQRMLDEFASLALSADQKAKVGRICKEAARDCVTTADVRRDGDLCRRCAEKVRSDVLDAKQRGKQDKAEPAEAKAADK